jgi:hypothetical protein
MTVENAPTTEGSPSVIPGAKRSAWQSVGLIVAFLAGLLAWLWAGVGVLATVILYSPDPGQGVAVAALKALLVAAWLGTVAWLALDFFRGRFRLVLAPIAAWILVYALGAILESVASINIGH